MNTTIEMMSDKELISFEIKKNIDQLKASSDKGMVVLKRIGRANFVICNSITFNFIEGTVLEKRCFTVPKDTIYK